MSRRRRAARWAVPALVALGLVVRLAGLRWGLPDGTHFFSWHPDEFSVGGTVNGMLNTGQLNPRFFNYGSLVIYLTWLVSWPLHATGIATGVVTTHVVGRLLAIAAGVGTIALVASLGRRMSGAATAWRAALFLALMPAHVLHSGFATVDVPAAFLVTLTVLLALRAGDAPSPARLLPAGAAAGLAAATKYNAGLVLLVPVVLVLTARALPAARRLLGATTCAAAAFVAFLVAMPYAVLDFAEFRKDVAFELFEHSRTGHLRIFEDTGNGWLYHLTANLPYLTGIPLAALAIAGLVVMARRRSRVDVALLTFALPYFAVAGASEVRFLRYLLPLAPVLALAGAEAVGAMERRARGGLTWAARPTLIVVAASLVLLTGLQQAALLKPDARARAAAWVERNAPPGTKVGLVGVPWFYTPPVTPWNGGPDTVPAFESYEQQRGRYRFVMCRDFDLDVLRAERPEIVLLSEFERREEERLGDATALAFLAALERDYRRVLATETFAPGARWIFGGFAPHDWLYPFARVTVWRRAGVAQP